MPTILRSSTTGKVREARPRRWRWSGSAAGGPGDVRPDAWPARRTPPCRVPALRVGQLATWAKAYDDRLRSQTSPGQIARTSPSRQHRRSWKADHVAQPPEPVRLRLVGWRHPAILAVAVSVASGFAQLVVAAALADVAAAFGEATWPVGIARSPRSGLSARSSGSGWPPGSSRPSAPRSCPAWPTVWAQAVLFLRAALGLPG